MDKYFKRLGLSENTVSLILGVLVVIVLAVVAYNLFRVKPDTSPAAQTEQEQTNESGELTNPTAAVSLPTEHTVVAGESLWTISEKYYGSGYNWMDIARVNKMANPDSIMVDQKLTISSVTVIKPVVQVTVNKIDSGSYTILNGDNLWTIAVRSYGDGYRFSEIARANNIPNPNLIYSGNVLIIPRP